MNGNIWVLASADSVAIATTLILAALGALFTERAGVLNLGVEGMMIMGAVCAFAGGWVVVLLDALSVPTTITLLVGSSLIILVRMLSIKFGWELKRWRFL